MDRRYLGMTLDIARGLVVAGIATLFFLHRAGLGSIYTMVILLGVGSAMYWSNINALVQEVISSGELVAANSAVLIAVQGGLAISGGLVGFIYDRAGIAGILAIDASSYFVSAFCLYRLRRGYFAPHVTHRIDLPEALETPLAVAEETSMPPLDRACIRIGIYRGISRRDWIPAQPSEYSGAGNHLRVHDRGRDQLERAGGGADQRYFARGRDRATD